jgi:hypothetical protein
LQNGANRDKYINFNNKVYGLITDQFLNTYTDKCAIYQDRCVNALLKEGQVQPRSRKIDQTFEHNGCLILGVITGQIDCKFWLRDGLAADIQAIKDLNNKALKSAVRKKEADWNVFVGFMPDDTQQHTKSYEEVCFCSHLYCTMNGFASLFCFLFVLQS